MTRFPVKETDTALALDTEKHTTTEAFGLEANVERGLFLEVAEDLDAHGRLANGVILVIFLGTPGKVKSLAESLISQSKSGVDDVFAITADGGKAAIRRMDESLGVDLGGSEILAGKG